MAQAKETIRAASVPAPQHVPTASIYVAPNKNLRTDFEEGLEGLTASIRERGIKTRLWVRVRPDDRFELIAGERRWRVATALELSEVPCEVYDCDDEEAEELSIIENLQREDLHPLDYADGFQKMIADHGYSIEQLAAKVNKGTTVIREYLHFAKLPESARLAFRQDRINKSICVLIGTIPDETRRAQFAKEVITGGPRGDAMSFRAAKELKERSYMKELKNAPFPIDEAELYPEAGSCLLCPHYNGNTPKQWQGKRADICLNPDCYQKKVGLNAERKLAATKVSDTVTTLPAEEGAKLFYSHGYLKDERFADTKDSVPDYRPGKPRVPILQIIKQTNAPVIVTTDGEGKLRTLIRKTDLNAATKSLGIQTSYSSASKGSRTKSKPSVSEKKKEAAAKCRTVAATALLNKLRGFNWRLATVKQWRELALVFFDSWFMGDGAELLLPLLGMAADKVNRGQDATKFICAHVAKLKTVSEIHGLIAACVVADRMETYTTKYGGPFDLKDLALGKLFRVDLKAIQTKAAEQLAVVEKATLKAVQKMKASKKPKLKLSAKPKAKAA